MVLVQQEELELHIKTKHRGFRVPIPLDNQIIGILKQEKTNYTDALISLLQRRLKEHDSKTGLFYCQDCSLPYPIKKRHLVPVGIEEFVFCDNCFFSDNYKEFIRRIL